MIRTSGSAMLEASGPAAAMMPAAAASRNQTGTSWLLATSPFLRASSSRFCVGSSVFWLLSCSSATLPHHELVGLFLHLGEPDHEAAAQPQRDHGKAEHDRERHGNHEHLDLRQEPRDEAKRDVEDQREHHHRRRDLDAEAE